jgi:hypothetical protein
VTSNSQIAPPQQLTGDKARKLLRDLAPLADSLSKGVAALAIAMYVCGFLTVSLHHANYGFVGTNPFAFVEVGYQHGQVSPLPQIWWFLNQLSSGYRSSAI